MWSKMRFDTLNRKRGSLVWRTDRQTEQLLAVQYLSSLQDFHVCRCMTLIFYPITLKT